MRNLQRRGRPGRPGRGPPGPPGQQQSQQWYLTSPDMTTQQLTAVELHEDVPYLRRLQPALLRQS